VIVIFMEVGTTSEWVLWVQPRT